MPIKYKLGLSVVIFVLLVGGYLLSIKEEETSRRQVEDEIKVQLDALNHSIPRILELETMDDHAIVFYRWGFSNSEKFGVAEFKKENNGWSFVSGFSTGEYPTTQSVELANYHLIIGNRGDEDAVEVVVENEGKTETPEGPIGLWYLISEEHAYSDANVKWLDGDGNVLKEMQLGQSD
ncbi:hypothetical protein MM221_07950 [Salipaludibacillus sp. LMS25]|uniref:hypothetical protein n=1 Tax=Salipaludibacillus sp. LMS25 TaxID=2924031 RepID=UPI0020D1B9B5|nr:hypothetical protein [Salipaludibacillus sp. LMS25]UTR16463.1 hypothetical protein MM221_07950 [Salipaludibacillus sp. LMS25]